MLMVLIMDPENKMFYQQVKYREQIHLTDFHLSAILKKNKRSLKTQKPGEPPFSPLEPVGSSTQKQYDIPNRIRSDS